MIASFVDISLQFFVTVNKRIAPKRNKYSIVGSSLHKLMILNMTILLVVTENFPCDNFIQEKDLEFYHEELQIPYTGR